MVEAFGSLQRHFVTQDPRDVVMSWALSKDHLMLQVPHEACQICSVHILEVLSECGLPRPAKARSCSHFALGTCRRWSSPKNFTWKSYKSHKIYESKTSQHGALVTAVVVAVVSSTRKLV